MKKRFVGILMLTAVWFAAVCGFAAGAGQAAEAAEKPKVYMTAEIPPAGLMKAYEALERPAVGRVAVKISTGEAGNTHYLSPALIGDLVRSVKGTIVESNTAYGGSCAETAMHRQVAKDHGFTAIADVDIMDADGEMTLPVRGGKNLKDNYVGADFAKYDFYIVLSHFKGHAMGGFGGAIKNTSIGIASAGGKAWIHSAGKSKTDPWANRDTAPTLSFVS